MTHSCETAFISTEVEVHSEGQHVFSVKLLHSLVRVPSNVTTSSMTTFAHPNQLEETVIRPFLCCPPVVSVSKPFGGEPGGPLVWGHLGLCVVLEQFWRTGGL